MNLKLAFITGVGLCTALSSCVDNNYDLSDVDTTVKIPVNNLTIPVNIEPVKLENIFNIDSDDPDNVIKVVNGEYAVSQTGHFESNNVEINAIELGHPTIESSSNIISLIGSRAAMPNEITYGIHSEARDFTYESSYVSGYIKDVDNVSCNLTLTMNIEFKELKGKVRNVTFKDIELQLPKGLSGVSMNDNTPCRYDKQTGVLSLPSYKSSGATVQFTVYASGVDVEYMESVGMATFRPSETGKDDGFMSVTGEMYLLNGNVTINAADLIVSSLTALPAQVTMTVDYDLNDTKVTNFTGKIYYEITEVDIPDVELKDLPDILTQESTNLLLENPQIYLTITNPFYQYNLKAVSGLQLTTHRTGKEDHSFMLDEQLVLDSSESPNGIFHFVLSPTNPTTRIEGYEDAKWLKFSDLGQVLAGEGLPNEISFELINPIVPTQQINNFELGVTIGTVNGDYDLMAPLGMSQGSQIVYSDDVDGWESEDLDHCTIENLSLALVISSDIPVDVNLSGYPIDTEGNRIYDANGNPISIDGAIIPPFADNEKISVHTTATIPSGSKLNGIRFVATAKSTSNDNPPLAPEMTLTLNNIRATVSGYYLKDLDE